MSTQDAYQQASFDLVEEFASDQSVVLLLEALAPWLADETNVRIKTGNSILSGDPPQSSYSIDRTRELVVIHTTTVHLLQSLQVAFQDISHTLTGWQPLCQTNSTLLQAVTEYKVSQWSLVDISNARSYPITPTQPSAQLAAALAPSATPPLQSTPQNHTNVLTIWLATVLGGFGSALASMFFHPLISAVFILIAIGGTIYGMNAGNNIIKIISALFLLLFLPLLVYFAGMGIIFLLLFLYSPYSPLHQ